MRTAVFRVLGLALLVSGCSGHEEPTFENPYDPRNGQGIPVPDSIVVVVSDNAVQLRWRVPAGETVDGFAVFRKRIDVESEDERLVGTVAEERFVDFGVRSRSVYEYRIAAGRNGQFGPRSDAVTARPGLYSILVADDAPRTRSATVTVALNASGAEAVRLSEDPLFPESPWRSVAGTLTWTLGPGDGEKTVYAVFRLLDGSETSPVYDTIVLDTQAVIRSVDFDGDDTREPGGEIRFRLDAGETGGRATIQVLGLFDALPLFDDGTNGDPVSGDGVYERQATIPAGRTVSSAVVRGQFLDEAGNIAAPVDAMRSLTVRQSPEAVVLLDPLLAQPPDAAAVTLRWTQSSATDFASYRLFRDTAAGVDSASYLAGTVTTRTTLELTDNRLAESETYWYRVYVLTSSGLQRGSNAVQVLVPNQRPPSAVTLQPADAVSETRLALRWSKSADRDFATYRVLRNDSGAVSETDRLVAEIADADQTWADDSGLVENSTYYYRVYVVDRGGLSARSNEIEVTTRNLAPPPVTLEPAGAADSTAVDLAWGQSTAHDFASYRLYRDSAPTVTTASTLVVEIDEVAATGFRDTGLDPDTLYYYRVFVFDDGGDPGPKSTGSNTISVRTTPSSPKKADNDPNETISRSAGLEPEAH